jgi:hypothetical protein
MPSAHKWKFKASFRREAFAWHGSALASKRLREAVSEIKKVTKTDPVAAADGVVSLMEKLWPSLQNIDTSSGALGNAVYHTLTALLQVLISAPADKKTRQVWLNRLYNAICDDGVDYLSPIKYSWGKICAFPEIINEWADMLLPNLRDHWQHKENSQPFFVGTPICLSCLLEAGRYDELREILNLQRHGFWHYDEYWAEALMRQGRASEALEFAETKLRDAINSQTAIMRFCEDLLLEMGRQEEAYTKYGLYLGLGTTYISQYRAIVKKYPEREPRQILLDLIARSGDKSSWFASARQAGFLDIALECACSGLVNPQTLSRAARDTAKTEPEFAFRIAFRAIYLLLIGYGYEPTTSDMTDAFNHFITAAEIMNVASEALSEIDQLLIQGEKGQNKHFREILSSLVIQARNKLKIT